MLILPIEDSKYDEMMSDKTIFRKELDKYIKRWPERFPKEIISGYHLHGMRSSKKLEGFVMQRIKLIEPDKDGSSIVLTIRPSGVLPYNTGHTGDVEKALYLRQYPVPYSALAYLFGRDASYWYRQETHLGRYSLVQTTVQKPRKLPKDLLADEKHSRLNGQKCYIPTTVGNECVLGVAVSMNATAKALKEGYGTFKEELAWFAPSYQPKTVNTDGWSATQNAWHSLFPKTEVVECILHAFISIRSRCKKKFKSLWPEIQEKFWDIYEAPTAKLFRKRLKAFQKWAAKMLSGTALEAINKLANKADIFVRWYDHPTARRTSNMIDRHMMPMDRYLDAMRYFHGHLSSAERAIRAWALIHNFAPFGNRTQKKHKRISYTHKLNRRVYHPNWLHNLLISTSNSPVFIPSHQFR